MEQTASTENQKQSQPSHRPEIKKTPVRGKRLPFWGKVAVTCIVSSFLLMGWLYNGKMSVAGLFILWEFLIHSSPPQGIVAMFTMTGWSLVILTSIGELTGFWCKMTRRPLPEWLRSLTTVFIGLFIYDLVTTILGVYQEWAPGMPIDLDHGFQLIVLVLYSLVITYFVEAFLSAIWKGL